MKVEVRDCRTDIVLHCFEDLPDETCILDIKKKIVQRNKRLPVVQQSLRTTPRGPSIHDNKRLIDLLDPKFPDCVHLFLRNLGPQVGWRTVFLFEYSGPLIIYFTMWLLRQPWVPNPVLAPIKSDVPLRTLFMICYCGHFVKRLAETLFVHRFSHATMPRFNLFKNSAYYFGFAAFIAYFTNHPLYTPPFYGCWQIGIGLATFLICEWGNFACHVALRNLRPPGSTVRQIPRPMPGWLTTRLFNIVACPNYTYEVLAWVGFTIMTQTFPAALFAIVGLGQMSIWALNKRKAYIKEFPSYPRNRKAILPFIL